MSDARLSDLPLDELEILELGTVIAEKAGDAIACTTPRMLRSLINEVHRHRARQLTPDDIESLRYDIRELASIAKDWVNRDRFKVFARIDECKSRAIALLALLAGDA